MTVPWRQADRPLIMGVVNVTPDSFSDGGLYENTEKAVAYAHQLIEQGADILDIGGESSRPGANPLTAAEEQERILPVIEALSRTDVLISIDTYHADTMTRAVRAGAGMINDITALTGDEDSLSSAARAQVPVCLMHMQGTPQTMQKNPSYDDIVSDVLKFLKERIAVCQAAGIAKENLVVDPGIGFGKTLDHNLALLRDIDRFEDLGVPVLLGVSRKSFIEMICGKTPAPERVPGSLAAALWGIGKGVRILRVHDVRETAQALAVYEAISSMK